jgi:hypothetical protein
MRIGQRAGRPRPTAELLVVANPEFQPAGAERVAEKPDDPRGIDAIARELFGVRSGLEPLAGAEQEGKELRTLFPGGTLLTGEQAQKATVKREAGKGKGAARTRGSGER